MSESLDLDCYRLIRAQLGFSLSRFCFESQPAYCWQGAEYLPESLVHFYWSFGPKNLSLGNPCLFYFPELKTLDLFQNRYRLCLPNRDLLSRWWVLGHVLYGPLIWDLETEQVMILNDQGAVIFQYKSLIVALNSWQPLMLRLAEKPSESLSMSLLKPYEPDLLYYRRGLMPAFSLVVVS
jgi:hypothetical protein